MYCGDHPRIAHLLEQGWAVYPVNPRTVERRRAPSGAKTDTTLAYLLAKTGRADFQDLREHIDQLESEIVTIVDQAREGQILMSFPGFGPITAATIIAAIGSIHNFPSASALKSYFGWAPVVAQSGDTLDASFLTRGGTRTMKQIMFLAVLQIIRLRDNEWARLYERLVKARCPFDERTQSYTGKMRVIGRVAGQMIEAIYALLKRDAELLSRIPQGQEPSPPLLYHPEVRQRHRQGQYRPLKSTPPPNVITITHPSSLERFHVSESLSYRVGLADARRVRTV
jgi:hypothetical protein